MRSSKKMRVHRFITGALALMTASLFWAAGSAVAAAQTADQKSGAAAQQIQIAADGFKANTSENYAEFTGNVQAVQGAFEILSDNLRVYYKADASRSRDPLAVGNAEIKEIVASGNVHITTDDRKAETEKAVYNMDSQVLVLSGENSTLSSDNNHISGSTITFNRQTRQVKIIGRDQNRVSGVFYPATHNREDPSQKTPGVVFLTPPPKQAAAKAELAREPDPTLTDTADSTPPPPETEFSKPISNAPEGDDPPKVGTSPDALPVVEELEEYSPEKAQISSEFETAQGEPPPADAVPEKSATFFEQAVPTENIQRDGPHTTATHGADTTPSGTHQEQIEIRTGVAAAANETTQKADTAGAPEEPLTPEPPAYQAEAVASSDTARKANVTVAPEETLATKPPSSQTVSMTEKTSDPQFEPAPAEALVLARAQSEPLTPSPPEMPKEPAAVPVVPMQNLTKRVGIALFENTTAFPDKGLGMLMLNKLADAIRKENSAVDLLLPEDPEYPGILIDLPRQASGYINNLLLVQAGRNLGLNAIVTGTLVDIKIMTEPTGFWIFKGSRVLARVVAQVAMYDTETGTKFLDELLVRKVEMDEADLYTAQKGQAPEIPGLEGMLTDMAETVGETIGEKLEDLSWRGFIVSADGGRVVLSSGSLSGLLAGNELVVYDETAITGLAGHRYYLPGQKAGKIQIINLLPNQAEAIVTSGRYVREGLPVADPDDDTAGKEGWAKRLKFW